MKIYSTIQHFLIITVLVNLSNTPITSLSHISVWGRVQTLYEKHIKSTITMGNERMEGPKGRCRGGDRRTGSGREVDALEGGGGKKREGDREKGG